MGTGYTRNDTTNNIADGNIIDAADLDGEFDAIQSAFNNTTGHTHDGTSAEGAPITVTGPAQEYVSTATEFRPKTNNTYDLGSLALQWKNLYVDGIAYLDSVDIDGGSIDGTAIGASTAAAGSFTTLGASGNATVGGTLGVTGTATFGTANITNLTATGTTTLAGASTTADITFGDNDKAIFGAGSDLQIYHDGSNSFIVDNGTGILAIKGSYGVNINGINNEAMATFVENGAATLYYNNSAKIATTATGVDVTGTVTADKLQITNATGGSVASNYAVIEGSTADNTNYPGLQLKGGTFATTYPEILLGNGGLTLNIKNGYAAGYPQRAEASVSNSGFTIRTSTSGTALNRFLAASNGDISFYEDTGTTPKMVWDASAEVLTSNTGGYWRLQPSGAASTPAYSFENDVDTGMYRPAGSANTVAFSTTGTERMRIDSSGNVGIGKSSSIVQKLEVKGGIKAESAANDSGLYLQHTGTAAAILSSYQSTGSYTPLAFYTSGSEKVRIDTSGNVGIGTSSPQTELHIEDGGGSTIRLTRADTATISGNPLGRIEFAHTDTDDAGVAAMIEGAGDGGTGEGRLEFHTGTPSALVERMRIDNSGNVLIGATSTSDTDYGAKFIKDGTTSTILAIHRQASSGDVAQFTRGGVDSGSISVIAGAASYNTSSASGLIGVDGDTLAFNTNSAERMRIDSSGNVGIGTSSPAYLLDIQQDGGGGLVRHRILNTGTLAADSSVLQLQISGTTAENLIYFGDTADNNAGQIRYDHASNFMSINVNASERMRIDSSGTLFIGKSSSNNTTKGATLTQSGDFQSTITTAGGAVQNIFLNRQDTDGRFITFRRSNADVGSIGVFAGDFIVGSTSGSDVAFRMDGTNDQIYASNAVGNGRDAAINLGAPLVRWKDLYLSGSISDGTTSRSVSDIVAGAGGAGYFQGENGATGDTTNGKGDIFRTHESTLNTNVTIASGDNSLAAGPLTVASGVTLTVSGNLSIV